MERRVVVTGIGVVAPSGIGREAFWRASLAGERRLAPIRRFDPTAFPVRVAGQVEGFDAAEWLAPRLLRQTDRSVHMGMAASRLAAEDAGLDLRGEDRERVGVVFANVLGGMEFAEPELYACTYQGPERVSAYQAIAWFFTAAQGQWTIDQGILGYAKTFVGDRAGGLQAVGWAARAIRAGECDVAFAGGFEAPLVPYAFLCHVTSGFLSPAADPDDAYLPFDRRGTGAALGEGAAVLVLEERGRALARGAPVYAEVAGYASGFDAFHPRDPDPSAAHLARCFRRALDDAGLAPGEIGYISADGAGTPAVDRGEAAAIRAVFGTRAPPPVSAPKAAVGHTLGAAGALDVAWTALMIRHGVILATPGLAQPDPELGLDLVTAPRHGALGAALCSARGHGGIHAGLVLRAPDGTR